MLIGVGIIVGKVARFKELFFLGGFAAVDEADEPSDASMVSNEEGFREMIDGQSFSEGADVDRFGTIMASRQDGKLEIQWSIFFFFV